MIDREDLKVLACPFCVTRPLAGKPHLAVGELEAVPSLESATALKCKDCGRSYPVDANGIPHLLIESATLS